MGRRAPEGPVCTDAGASPHTASLLPVSHTDSLMYILKADTQSVQEIVQDTQKIAQRRRYRYVADPVSVLP